MSIVRFDKSKKVCATCAHWQGIRQAENSRVVFNNRDSGICGGISFKDWKMGATSSCTEWQSLDDVKQEDSVDTKPVNKMTQTSTS